MSTVTVNFLLGRHATASSRWWAAMSRKGYQDDPDEAVATFDWSLYGWADAWRCAVHAVEAALAKIPEFREAGRFVADDGKIFYVADLSFDDLATQTVESPESPPEPTPSQRRGTPRKPRTIRRS